MASAFGHAIAAVGIGKLFPQKIMHSKVYVLGATSAILPDLDIISYHFGLYDLSIWTHRGITHSFFAAFLWAGILLLIFHWKQAKKAKIVLFNYYFIATASHGFLDALTNGGDGVAFLAPFSDERIFLPFRPIQVSPIGISNFFSEWGISVLKSEFIFIMLPSLALFLIGKLINKKI
jgi:inner membrane protein